MGPWAGTTGPDVARRPQTTGPLRFVRGAIVGTSAVVLGAGGHTLASGMTPTTSSLLVASVVAVLVGIVMSGRRWRLPSLITVLAVAQLAFHVLLSGTQAMPRRRGRRSLRGSRDSRREVQVMSMRATGHRPT